MRPKNLKKCMKINWNFQKGGEVSGKILSVGEVWIFSGTTQSSYQESENELIVRSKTEDNNAFIGHVIENLVLILI